MGRTGTPHRRQFRSGIAGEGDRLDKAAALAHLQQLQLDDYTLGDVHAEMNGDTFVVTYTVAMKGTFAGQPLPSEPVRMMTVWQKEKSGWMAIAHSAVGRKSNSPALRNHYRRFKFA